MTQETQPEHPDPTEAQEDEASVEEIENDPSHEPPEEGLKDLKGG